MSVVIRAYEPGDQAALGMLLRSPGIREQYDILAGPAGADKLLADPYVPHAGVNLAFVADEPVGFACAIVLPGPPAPWSALRGGVLTPYRRRGIGRALYMAVVAYLRTAEPPTDVRETTISAWQPEPGADALTRRLGYSHDRWYWLMERPRGATPPVPSWPDDVTVRVLDGSDAMLADWNDAYNASFAEHHRFVATPLEHVHHLVRKPGFRADGVLLAYRNGRVAGFARNELQASRGEVATLGTVPGARGIGLGRALLRWGVAWLEQASTLPVSLMVDGANEGALGLYRSEGFEVTRTRRVWVRSAEVR